MRSCVLIGCGLTEGREASIVRGWRSSWTRCGLTQRRSVRNGNVARASFSWDAAYVGTAD